MTKFKIKKLGTFLSVFVVVWITLLVINVFAATTSTLMPSADGGEDSASWLNTGAAACNAADCYLEVDETAGAECSNSDGDTSYLYSDGIDVSQTFDVDESSIPDGASITNIDVTTCYFKEGSAGGTFQTRYCFDGACTSSGTDITTGNSYTEATQSFSVSHTKASGSDIEIGVINTSVKDVRISQISTVITYSAADSTPPATTSDLAASGPTSSTIDLDWTAPGDDGTSGTATTYDIRYSTATINDGNWASATPVSPNEPSPSVAGTAESMTVTGLNADTTYYFAMKTSDEVPNESALSNVTSAATSVVGDTTPPSTTSDLAASGPTTTTIDLDWTAPGDDDTSGTATTYDIRYSTATINDGNWASATPVSPNEPSPSVAGTAESMTVTGLTSNTTYYFAMKTSDEVPNESALSNVTSDTTTVSGDSTPPATTSDLAASGPTATTIDLDWTAPGDDDTSGTATTYDIRYSTATINDGNWASATPVSPNEPSPSVAGTAESMTVTGLSQSTTYYFAMKTSDEAPNESALSNVTNSTTGASGDSTPPSTTSDLAASGPTSSTIDLDWTAPGDDDTSGTATTYDIRYSTATIDDGNWGSATTVTGEPSPSVAGTAESMTVTGLSQSTTYYFAMKTRDEVPNESGLSNVTNATTIESSVSIPAGGGSVATKIVFSGQAFPGSQMVFSMTDDVNPLYNNNPIIVNTMSGDGEFYISYTALLTGKYFITLKAVDVDEKETGSMFFRVDFVSEPRLVVEDMLISPTISLGKESLNLSEKLTVFGYAADNSTVELSLDGVHKFETIADADGSYLFEIPAIEIEEGMYFAKVKQSWNDRTSSYSYPITFKISGDGITNTDLNEDEIIDITDWSIFLFRWGD
ncbi:fibronectin type III domain-containing protein, partial [Patescibacteria group bacterium]